MYTLYIDTHFNDLVLAIFKSDEILMEKKLNSNKFSHSESTIPLLKELLNDCKIRPNDLQEIIVILGPGSFTGVRIGIVIAKILGYTLNLKIKAISYLEAMSLNFEKDVVLGIKDRNGAFIGEFDSNHNLVKEYYYLKNTEVDNMKTNIVFDSEVDLKKVKQYVKNKDGVFPHSLVPLYIKKIEVELWLEMLMFMIFQE